MTSPRTQCVSAEGKQAVLFGFRYSQQFLDAAPPVHLRGLDAKATYNVRWFDGRTGIDTDGGCDSPLIVLSKL